jgi:hypothetical protein
MNSPKPIRRLISLAICATLTTLIFTRIAYPALFPTATWTDTFDGSGSFPNDGFLASPAIGSDGTVYIAGAIEGSSHERRLYALNGSTGAILTGWPLSLGVRDRTGHGIVDDKGNEGSAAIGPDGSLYIGSWNYKIYKINPSTRQIVTNFLTTPNLGVLRTAPIVANGYVYCWVNGYAADPSPHPHLVILNASTMDLVGTWLDNGVYGDAIASPALGRDQKLYVCTHEYTDKNNAFSHIYAIDVSIPSSPRKAWGYPQGCIGTIVASPVIAADGKLYVCTRDGAMNGGTTTHAPAVICFDPASATPQTPIWTCTTGGFRPIDGTSAIGRIGDLYVPNDLNNSTSLSAMDPRVQADGNDYSAEWDVSFTVEKFDSGPVVASDETVFAKSVNKDSPHAATLRKISNGTQVDTAAVGNDTLAWHTHPDDGGGIDAVFSSPAISASGKLYVATAGSDSGGTPTGAGSITCFDTGTSAPGFWPNYRGNQYNTGNVQDNRWTTNSAANTAASIAALSTYPSSGESKAYSINKLNTVVGYMPYTGHSAACDWANAGGYPSRMTYWGGWGFYYNYVAGGVKRS